VPACGVEVDGLRFPSAEHRIVTEDHSDRMSGIIPW
jgi:hypothetical protein